MVMVRLRYSYGILRAHQVSEHTRLHTTRLRRFEERRMKDSFDGATENEVGFAYRQLGCNASFHFLKKDEFYT